MNNFIQEIRYQINRLRNFIHRAFFGWGHQDIWSLDAYLAKVIYESLVYLKANQYGCPIIIPMKDPNNKDELKKNEGEWDRLFNEMIYGWKLRKEIGEGKRQYYSPKLDKKTKKDLNCLTKEEDKKMIKGMKLFIKYFDCLWD